MTAITFEMKENKMIVIRLTINSILVTRPKNVSGLIETF